MARIKMNCPRCGETHETNMPDTIITCRCGRSFNLNNGVCEHGERKGKCDRFSCPFKKY